MGPVEEIIVNKLVAEFDPGKFEGKRLVQRHQMVYAVLRDELAGPVHALAIHTYTSEEWHAKERSAPESPKCHGG